MNGAKNKISVPPSSAITLLKVEKYGQEHVIDGECFMIIMVQVKKLVCCRTVSRCLQKPN